MKHPKITMEMENGGIIVFELTPEHAPNTVSNFIALAKDGFYDGLIFHRVIPGFMIQGGDPLGTGMGGPGFRIAGEFYVGGFENTLDHKRGVISMARASDPNSAGSQFFITVADSPHLNGNYAAFGKVVSGIEVCDQIVSVKTGAADRPLEPQTIKRMTVETFGVDISAPERAHE